MNKLINEALRNIKEWRELKLDNGDHNLKYWLTHLYRQGYIAGLEFTLKNHAKK